MCPAVNVQPDFDMESYLGTWYELYRSNDIPKYNESGECTTAHYSAKHGDNIKVENTSQDVNPDGTYEKRVEKSPGEAGFQDPEEKNGHLKIRQSMFQPWGSYNILMTDYENFAVIYECDNFLFDTQKIEYVWVMTRMPLNHSSKKDQAIIQSIGAAAKDTLARNNIEYDFDEKMHKSYHTE